ncbi:MAG: cardiolipin synthase [Erysipelotrichia bacterium]|jgi:cardiolipin synthase|nr:cardiolipin synthase [Erysipelotrichia bacterium]
MKNKKDIEAVFLSEKNRMSKLSFLFGSTGFVFLILLLEIIFIIVIYLKLLDYIIPIISIIVIFDFIILLYMLNDDEDYESYKITWAVIILLVPILGSVAYLFVKLDIFNNRYKKYFINKNLDFSQYIETDEKLLKKIKKDDIELYHLHNYLKKAGNRGIYSNCEVKYFPSGEEMFPVYIEELKKAEKFIFLEYFIIDRGKMWNQILEILIEKVSVGVDVRVIYDGTCDFTKLPANYHKRLNKIGIKCVKFAPLYPFISTYFNFRDHRKMTVIDGKVAFTGGINLADEYINEKEVFGYWKDTAVMIKGEAVKSFTVMFLKMSVIAINEKEIEYINCSNGLKYEQKGYVIPYGDIPMDKYLVGKNVYLDVLNQAKKYVYIMSPYFILDDEFLNSIKFAAKKGIDVRILLPGIPDKKYINKIAKSYYKTMIEAGVKIYEYTKGFVHGKMMVSDDKKAIVGTINLDYRSLYHHFENAVYLYGNDAVLDVKNDMLASINESLEITNEEVLKQKLLTKIIAYIFKIFEPLL